MDSNIKIALAQIAPIWLDREATTIKILDYLSKAAAENCDLTIFGEAILPGYPHWLSFLNGAEFDSPLHKQMHAHYLNNAVVIDRGDLNSICKMALKSSMAVYLGIVERPKDRGGHSLYCSLVYINREGRIASVHRKLMPTYEERLTWSIGDGHGLQVHKLCGFTVGGLNCWENWMPLSRTALYGLGENLHIATWPGSKRNTEDITRYIAKESRSFVVSVSGLMRQTDFPESTPFLDQILSKSPGLLSDGGSCIAGPNGQWIIAPAVGGESLLIETLQLNDVLKERHNFDPAGHYSRPDVTRLIVNRKRQSLISFDEEEE
jgi:nitrilase